ncbi:MAG TPA: galactose oxidase-like domain-containing protein [Bacteroidia bacterium]|nr:galactose oxidase-like domain-containing protein [Bacteroidia bacterium]
MYKKFILFTAITLFVLVIKNAYSQSSVSGQVNNNTSTGISGARITLFNSGLTYFREVRTNATGAFTIPNVPAGNYSLGAEKMGKDYVQQSVSIPLGAPVIITLYNETQPGQWNVIVNSPEPLGGTNLGALMPDGKIFFCHETVDPFYFDPSINNTLSAPSSSSVQGCVGPVLREDGKLWFIGGALVPTYGPGSRKVKYFDPVINVWQFQPDMLDYRWYPSVIKLASNKILIAGGGNLNNPVRTNTSEIYNPTSGTSVFTDTIAIGNEVSPIILLYNGKVLMTHRPPQLFNPANNQWNLAGAFVQSPRTPNGDHADHELVLMPNGEAIAIGYKSFTAGVYGTFVERYNPTTDSWSLGTSILPIRSRAKTVLLPDKKILTIGGFKENPSDTTSTNSYGYMNLCDMYNPASDSWRRLARLNYRREYHCNTILIPDGRVIAVGGEGQPGNEPPFSVIEAFNPPYLYRGIRPSISWIDTLTYSRGEEIDFTVNYADSLTAVQLLSTAVVTHFMNSGNNRFLELNFIQTGGNVSANIPSDSVTAPDGYYMLFAMVDDIPSIAKIIRISGKSSSSCVPPSASISTSGPITICSGGSVGLNAFSQANRTYQWKKAGIDIAGATLSSYTATTGGNYKVVVTNTLTGCSKTTATGTLVTVNALPSATITAQGPTTFCTGGNVVLNAPVAVNRSYQWKKGANIISGATLSSYTATTGGNYRVIVTNIVTGCSKTTTSATVVTVNSLPVATITPQGPTTFCAGGSVVLQANMGAGLTYKWKKGANYISGAISSNYMATTAGTYKVEVTNSNSCSKTSSGVTVTVPCREGEKLISQNPFNFSVAPNPSRGEIILTFNNSINMGIVKIFNALNEKVFEEQILNESKKEIHLKNISAGIYFIKIYYEEKQYTKKFIIEN